MRPLQLHIALSAIVAVMCSGLASAETAPTAAITLDRAFPLRGQAMQLGVRGTQFPPDSAFTIDLHLLTDGALMDLPAKIGTLSAATDAFGAFHVQMTWIPLWSGFNRIEAALSGAGMELAATARIPVVEREMHNIWYGYGADLEGATAVTPAPREAEVQQVLRDRGVRFLQWKGARADDARQLAENWADFGENDGIAIDEIGLYEGDQPSENRWRVPLDALSLFRETNPDSFVAVWNAGSLTHTAANYYRRHADLVLMECYQNYVRQGFGSHSFRRYIDQRVEMARRMDILQKSLLGLGITANLGGITPGELVAQVEYYRLVAPESPGIAWFLYAGPQRVDPAVLATAQAVFEEYFLKPCLMVRGEDIHYEPIAPGGLSVNIHNIGAMDARDVDVAFYLGHPDQGGSLIGRDRVSFIHAPRGWSTELDDLPPLEARNIAYGIATVSVPWGPA